MTRLRLSPFRDAFINGCAPTLWPDELRDWLRDPFSVLREPLFHTGEWASALSVRESDSAYTVQVDLPGVDPADVDVQLDGDLLAISGERKDEEREGAYVRRELSPGRFRHQVRLPGKVDGSNVSATHDLGVLTVTLPKRPDVTPRKIDVATS